MRQIQYIVLLLVRRYHVCIYVVLQKADVIYIEAGSVFLEA